jgi:hypothetical protein
MSDSNSTGFGKFVPGFDFLQGLAKGQPAQMHGMPTWVAPTLDPKELDKRIEELKAVQFWLDQNATALKATIQALEVQKMTLATLKGMNLDMNAMAQAFQFPAAGAPAKPQPAAEPAAAPGRANTAAGSGKPAGKSAKAATSAATPALDPMQLWGSLSQQFQQIATGALQEVARQAAAAPVQAAKPATASTDSARAGGTKTAKKPGAGSR